MCGVATVTYCTYAGERHRDVIARRYSCESLLRHCHKMVDYTEQRCAIKFMQKEGEVAANVFLRLRNVYSATCMSRDRVGLNNKDILLQHDNARPHTALRTQQMIQKIGWTRLPHPPYSPDLAPSDYHLFGAMKKSLTQYSSVE